MPELFGICAAEALSPVQTAAFARLEENLLTTCSSRTERQNGGWWKMSTIALHARDQADIIVDDECQTVLGWIGRKPDALEHGDAGKSSLGDVAQSIEEAPEKCFMGLDPPFAGCLVDLQSRRLSLFSDPYGLHPVYYACQNGFLAFCTKLTPLLRSALVGWKLDPQAVLDFFTYEHVTGYRTFADNVKVLPPGTILTFRNGRLNMSSYAPRQTSGPTTSPSARRTAHRLYDALSRSVARSLRVGPRVAVTLSGGLDSRALLGCAVEQRADVRAYTFGIPGCRDIAYASELSQTCNVPHTVVEVDGSHLPKWLDHGIYVTGGMVNCIHYHILALAEILASDADVVLDGLGGDALTGGHLKWGMVLANKPERALDALYRQRATAWPTRQARAELFHPDFLRQTDYDPKDAVRLHFTDMPGAPAWYACHRFDLLERQRRFIQYGPHLLRPLVAVNTPFYSRGLVGLLRSAPLSHLLEQRAYLLVHSHHLRALAGVPDSGRGVPLTLPPAVRFGKKALDFVRRRLPRRLPWIQRPTEASPTRYAEWFRTRLSDFVDERLLDARTRFEGMIQRGAVERIAREHHQGIEDHTNKIGCFLTFGTWLRSVEQGGSRCARSRRVCRIHTGAV